MDSLKPKQPSANGTPEIPSVQKLPAFETPHGTGVPESYKQAANSGGNVMWRASIKGRKSLSTGIPLHVSLKTFDKPEDLPIDEIQQKVKELNIQRPDPNKLQYEATTHVSPKTGQSYYMLKLHNHAPAHEAFNQHFNGRGISYPKYMQHITIDKELHDQIQKEGIGPGDVQFSPLMIEQGANNPTHIFPDQQSHNDATDEVTPKRLGPNQTLGKSEDFEKSEYRDSHKSPDHESGAPLHEMTGNGTFPHDIYSHKAAHIYGHGSDKKQDHDSIKTIHSVKGQPEKMVTVHRAVPHHVNKINPGDWVSINKDYAKEHGEARFDGKYKLLSAKVPAKEVYTKDSIHEQGWHPHLKKSEFWEPLEKSAIKRFGMAAAALGALSGSPQMAQAPKPSQQEMSNQYSSQRMLNAMRQVETSGGQNLNHPQAANGMTAIGSYALMPDTIRDTVKMNPDLKRNHPRILALQNKDMAHYLQDNPELEQAVAERHLNRLEHHFGHDPSKIAFGWLNGIVGTNKALKNHQDINNHWHVKKVNNAYNSMKSGVK